MSLPPISFCKGWRNLENKTLWMSNETRIRPKNHVEEVKDDYDMIQRGFLLGFTKTQLTKKKCLQCSP